MVPGANLIIAAARKKIGITEHPPGSNDGEGLRFMLRGTSFMPGDRWCMFFVTACMLEAFGNFVKLPRSFRPTGSCEEAAEFAAEQGKLVADAATGAIFVLHNSAGHFHHAGIVTDVVDGGRRIHTIEGNSNEPGSDNGGSVVARVRSLESLKFIVWEKLP